jgi:hypothetical protein
MSWLEKNDLAINVNMPNIEVVFPFQKDRVYWQLDLEVLGSLSLAAAYQGKDYSEKFAGNIFKQLEESRTRDIGSVAIYIEHDILTASDSCYAFIVDDLNLIQ